MKKNFGLLITLSLSLFIYNTSHAAGTNSSALTFNKMKLSADVPLSGDLTWLHADNYAKHLLIADKSYAARRFILFSNIEKTSSSKAFVTMPKEAIAYSTGKLAHHEEEVLLYLTHNEVVSYNVSTKKHTSLLSSSSIYSGENVISPSKDITFTQDLNNDGLTDFILTDFDTSHIFIQTPDGKFQSFDIEMKPYTELWRESRTFYQQSFKLFDANHDGLTDIVYQKEDYLFVHPQLKNNSFQYRPEIILLNAGIVSRQTIEAKRQESEGKVKLDYATFVDLIDINNDQLVDLITQRKVREGMFSNHGTLELRYGYIDDNLIAFPESPSTKLPYEGQMMSISSTINNYQFSDLNGDGLKDLYFPRKDFGFSDIISGLISRSTDVNIEFYLLRKQQTFAEKPDQDKEIELAFDLDSETAEIPLFVLEDFNGDTIKDLLIQIDDDKARLYIGNQQGPFNRKGKRYSMPLPRNGNLVQVKDINLDGRADIVFRYDNVDSVTKAKTVEIWTSQTPDLMVKN